jgi:MFS family permease
LAVAPYRKAVALPKSQGRLRQSFAALAFPEYRAFAASLLLTSLGVQLIQAAILWQVYELTGSEVALGLTGLARAVPHIILSLVGGVFADRVNRVRLIQTGQVANGILIFVLAGLTIAGSVEVWHLYVITLLNGGFTAVTQPARSAIIPWLIPREKLTNAVALNSTISQTSQITGPALAGVLIGVVGLGPVYVINGIVYVAAMLTIFGVKVPKLVVDASESPWQSFAGGLRFVRSRPVITSLLALDLGQTILASYRALLPVFADRLGVGASGYGFLSAAPGVGSVLGSAFILSLGDMKYKGVYTIFGVLANCATVIMLAVSPWYSLAIIASVLNGATNSVQAIPRNSAIIAISPDAMRGRVEAYRSMLAGGGTPLGYALSGVLAAALGPPLALIAGSIACCALVAGIAGTRKELRDPYLGSETAPDPPGAGLGQGADAAKAPS